MVNYIAYNVNLWVHVFGKKIFDHFKNISLIASETGVKARVYAPILNFFETEKAHGCCDLHRAKLREY